MAKKHSGKVISTSFRFLTNLVLEYRYAAPKCPTFDIRDRYQLCKKTLAKQLNDRINE